MRRKSWRLVLILCLAAWGMLREAGADVRFHPDEALYSTYARNAVTFGYWDLRGPVDKPPVSLYVNALAQNFFAARMTPLHVIDVPLLAGEFAAKMPNIFAGMLSVALVYALAKRLYPHPQDEIALLAALMMAVAPFSRAYSASAFTDMLMLMWALGAILAISARRDWLGGFLLAVSFATKPQALFLAPLILVWMPFNHATLPRLKGIIYGFACGVGLLLLWDIVRPEDSIFTLGTGHLDRDGFFTPISLWGDKLSKLLHHGRALLGVPGWTTAVIAVIILTGLRRILALWIIVFLGMHVIVDLPAFDRYLLPLLPALCWLGAEALSEIARRWQIWPVVIAAVIAFGLLGEHDPRADVFHPSAPDAYPRLAAWINEKPIGAILYNRWLGWEMEYYLGAWTDKRRVYYPSPEDFAADAPRNPDTAPRYFLVSEDRLDEVRAWLDAAWQIGFTVRLDFAYGGLRLYALIPPSEA